MRVLLRHTPSPCLLSRRPPEGGYALFLVVLLGSIALLTLAGTMKWCTTNVTLNQRNNQYFRTVAAAEAATEKVLSHLIDDYQRDGDAGNANHLADYRTMVPTTAESSLWADYTFSDAQGNDGQTWVQFVPPSSFRVLLSQYRGLYGYASRYNIISNARKLGGSFDLTVGVWQQVEASTIPAFQFAIFYTMELEINPGANMTVSGPVHCNTNIYLQPQAVLRFQDDVTSAGYIIQNKKPTDPTSRTPGTIVYEGEHDNQVSALTLPIGTNNTPIAVRQVVEIPAVGESPSSAMGQQRYYNKADLVIKVTGAGTTATSGLVNNFGTSIPASQHGKFLRTDLSFFNKRENKTIKAIQIDVGALAQWNRTNTLLRPLIPDGDLRTVFVDDQRSQTSSTESGVRLVNGQTLLPQGLTVATPEPLYVQGHYNCPTAALGTFDTSDTKPASLIGDAITILSPNWNDANSTKDLSSRSAVSTTVNAAILAGIVQTVSGSYSGGVENFPRFLEDWAGDTFTYNGSMVVMYESRYATGLWQGTGSSIGIYNPPTRNWAFDQNFRDPAKLPAATPQMRAMVRGQWGMLRSNTTTVAP